MDIKEDAYSNRSSLTADKRYLGYPANPVLFSFAASALIGVQLHSLFLFAVSITFSLLVLGFVCRDDPNGIAVWLYVVRRRLLKRIAYLSPEVTAGRPFIFTE